jgi:transcriptional regulator with XRE-family HTH domain
MPELAARAAELRAAGVGAKRIAAQLGIPYGRAQELLRGVPVPSSLMRVRAKDELRDVAIQLRREGRTYPEIRDELGVSKSSLSLWLRDLDFPTEEQRTALRAGTPGEPADEALLTGSELARELRAEGWVLREIAEELGVAPKTAYVWCKGIPVPPRAVHGRSPDEMRAMNRKRWDAELDRLDVVRQELITASLLKVGSLSVREADLAMATAYWCEGAKSKPWQRRETLDFINSDPDLIRLFCWWLARRNVPHSQCHLRVHIHETGDLQAATAFWAEVVGGTAASFAKPVIKRHNPKTKRKNIGVGYRGCLAISVRQSRDLYREIEGLWRGVAAGLPLDDERDAAH